MHSSHICVTSPESSLYYILHRWPRIYLLNSELVNCKVFGFHDSHCFYWSKTIPLVAVEPFQSSCPPNLPGKSFLEVQAFMKWCVDPVSFGDFMCINRHYSSFHASLFSSNWIKSLWNHILKPKVLFVSWSLQMENF